MKEKIKEVIVVEGKDDTKRLKQVFEVDTIETGGDALNEGTLQTIAHALKKRGVIIFTDPDHSGEKIRRTLMAQFPNAKHAFITKKQGEPMKKGSLGVEHASDEALKEALANVMTVACATDTAIPQKTLMHYGLIIGKEAKQRRAQLGEKLHIGYANGKQLAKRLAMFQITEEQLKQAMDEIDGGDE